MSLFWSPSIRGLKPYQAGEQPSMADLIKLNTNENPYPPSPKVLAAIKSATNENLRLYPDPEGCALKKTIAQMHGLTSEHVFLGNGSDEVLAHAFLALLKHEKPIFFPDITYSFYPVYCGLYGIDYRTQPLNDEYQINIDDYSESNGGIVIPNPNAPTGAVLAFEKIKKLLACHPHSVVVIDEAYVDFGAQSAVNLIADFPNLLVIQTLSKSRSLAGMRVGFALGHPTLIAALNIVKGSFNSYPLDRLALAGAQAALLDHEYFEATKQQVIQSREWLSNELRSLGFDVVPSLANFIFVRHYSMAADHLLFYLRENSILVRHFALPRISNHLRISIGTQTQCEKLMQVLRKMPTFLPTERTI